MNNVNFFIITGYGVNTKAGLVFGSTGTSMVGKIYKDTQYEEDSQELSVNSDQ